MAAPTLYSERARRADWMPLAILALVLLISLIVRIRLLDAPLERDEGEHGYMAQTMLAGYAPWRLAYNLKLPGTDAMYAIFLAIFGQTAVAIRIGLLIVNTATILLIALVGKGLYGFSGGAVAGASYGLLSCSQGVLGTIAHSTHFVVFFAAIATLILMKSGDRVVMLFLGGLMFGVAFLMKQPGICFGVYGLLCLLWRFRSGRARAPLLSILKSLAAYCLGVVLPYGLLCAALWAAGTFARFSFWTITLASAYAASLSFHSALENLSLGFPTAVGSNPALWVLAVIGLALVCWHPDFRRTGIFLTGLLAISFLAVCAGGAFNPHYFIFMLPAVALANGAALVGAERLARGSRQGTPPLAITRFAGTVALSFFGLACAYSIVSQRDYLFRMSTYEFERSSYGLNPFPEAVQIADYIRSHSDPAARIAVLGSEAEIYFYSRRRAATGYLFTYGLMETHKYAVPCQLEMISEIETSQPEYLVLVGIGTSWLARPGSSREIFRWALDYTRQHYHVVGAIDMEPGQPSKYVWGSEALVYNAASPYYLTVFQRR